MINSSTLIYQHLAYHRFSDGTSTQKPTFLLFYQVHVLDYMICYSLSLKEPYFSFFLAVVYAEKELLLPCL